MEQLKGLVDHIIYSKPETGYTVFELTTDTELITCVGILHAVSEGETVDLRGDYTNHPLYGRQFSFESFEIIEAADEEAIRRYLASGAVKGIGPALANRIVDEFSDDTFRVMEEEPELLAKIKGISLRKAQEIAAAVVEKQDLRKVMLFLQKYGISNNMAMKIYKEYGNTVYSVIEENPYKLAEDVDGIGFKIADEIATLAGIALDSVYRIKSGIIYCLTNGIGEGHIYLPKELLIYRAKEILNVEEEMIWLQVENLSMERKLIIKQSDDEIRVYSNNFYYMELNCARMLRDLDVIVANKEADIRKSIGNTGKTDETELEELQLEAVVNAITHGVCVITGGPGTGKTTTINRIIKYLEQTGEDFCLAAPTGRAAKRMTETTGYEASTIQRMLGLGKGVSIEKGYYYEKNEENPLETDTIIIDEMSMVDLPLFHALLRAIMPGTRLVLVGDINQLPSVGPGSVLKDIINSGCLKVVKLEKIFRQAGKSDIVINAHKINDGIMPKLDNKSEDFFFLKRDDVNVIMKNIVQLLSEKLPKYVEASTLDIQVLTPMRKGALGVESLNPILQKYINPPSKDKKEKEGLNVLFREGDKVMQIKNNYQLEWEVQGKYGIAVEKGLGVFNGDMGIIKRIDFFSEMIEVLYEENHLVHYPFSNLDELELAYAVTIHKSQGSEYPAVILPILTGPKPLFNRNLLYTAVTRAKRCVTILGNEETIKQMVDNTDEAKRYTSLSEMIKTIFMEDYDS